MTLKVTEQRLTIMGLQIMLFSANSSKSLFLSKQTDNMFLEQRQASVTQCRGETLGRPSGI